MLDTLQIANITAALSARGVGQECPACKKGKMSVFPYPFLMQMHGSNEPADFTGYMCHSCSHTMFFSARSPSLLLKFAASPDGKVSG